MKDLRTVVLSLFQVLWPTLFSPYIYYFHLIYIFYFYFTMVVELKNSNLNSFFCGNCFTPVICFVFFVCTFSSTQTTVLHTVFEIQIHCEFISFCLYESVPSPRLSCFHKLLVYLGYKGPSISGVIVRFLLYRQITFCELAMQLMMRKRSFLEILLSRASICKWQKWN